MYENYLALLACIISDKLTVNKALSAVGIKVDYKTDGRKKVKAML